MPERGRCFIMESETLSRTVGVDKKVEGSLKKISGG